MSRKKCNKKIHGIVLSMKRETTINGFGKRLAQFRKAKGLSQKELGEAIDVSNRVISYYERESKYPPAHLIAPLAKTLGTSTDELLGLKASKGQGSKSRLSLQRRLKKIEELPPTQQKILLQSIDMFLKGAEK